MLEILVITNLCQKVLCKVLKEKNSVKEDIMMTDLEEIEIEIGIVMDIDLAEEADSGVIVTEIDHLDMVIVIKMSLNMNLREIKAVVTQYHNHLLWVRVEIHSLLKAKNAVVLFVVVEVVVWEEKHMVLAVLT